MFLKQATNTTAFLVYVDGTLVSTITGSNNAATQIDDCYTDLVHEDSIGTTFDVTSLVVQMFI